MKGVVLLGVVIAALVAGSASAMEARAPTATEAERAVKERFREEMREQLFSGYRVLGCHPAGADRRVCRSVLYGVDLITNHDNLRCRTRTGVRTGRARGRSQETVAGRYVTFGIETAC